MEANEKSWSRMEAARTRSQTKTDLSRAKTTQTELDSDKVGLDSDSVEIGNEGFCCKKIKVTWRDEIRFPRRPPWTIGGGPPEMTRALKVQSTSSANNLNLS
ncbi:hypothetical protein CR513_26245, partial [Mucuna pruriens]